MMKTTKTVTFKNAVKDHSPTSHTPAINSLTQPKPAGSHLLKSTSLFLSIKTSSMCNCPPMSWMLSEEPSSTTWSTVPCASSSSGMAQSPQASPEDHPSLLGCLGWTVHRGWYSPQGISHLHPPRVPQQNLADLHSTHQGIEKMQALAQDIVYLQDIDANIAHYVNRCAIYPGRYIITAPSSNQAKPMMPMDMEMNCDYLIAKKQAQKTSQPWTPARRYHSSPQPTSTHTPWAPLLT